MKQLLIALLSFILFVSCGNNSFEEYSELLKSTKSIEKNEYYKNIFQRKLVILQQKIDWVIRLKELFFNGIDEDDTDTAVEMLKESKDLEIEALALLKIIMKLD